MRRMGKIEQNKKRKQTALYDTAYDLFTTKGIQNTAISDIVEKAGVAKGTFYLYFKDKYDIKNKLVVRKASELFSEANIALEKTDITGLTECLLFIMHTILDKLEKNHSLLIFIAKNLGWGVFRSMLNQPMDKEEKDGFNFYEIFEKMLEKEEAAYYEPDIMLFTILELVSSTCYSSILYSEPVPMDEYRPYLDRAIVGIIKSHQNPVQ